MNYKWNYEAPSPEAQAQAQELAKGVGIHPALGKLLLDRGLSTVAEAKRFFRPQLTELHDPFLMNDMDVAVERLNGAMVRREKIMVYGDYDVDGSTPTSTTTSPTATTRATACRAKALTMRPSVE